MVIFNRLPYILLTSSSRGAVEGQLAQASCKGNLLAHLNKAASLDNCTLRKKIINRQQYYASYVLQSGNSEHEKHSLPAQPQFNIL